MDFEVSSHISYNALKTIELTMNHYPKYSQTKRHHLKCKQIETSRKT